MVYNNLRPLSSALSLQPSGTREKRAASQMGGPHQMGSRGYGAKRFEGRGKRLLAWQPLKQQGLPHSMDVVHGLVSVSDWRAGERRKGPSKRPSCLRTERNADVFSGKASSCALERSRGQFKRVPLKSAEHLVFFLWVEVSHLTSGICGCGGVGVSDKKLRTAVSVHIQVTWRKKPACICSL